MSVAQGAGWFLAEPLDLGWRSLALCRERQDLPWTPDVLPDAVSLWEMRALCESCPVRGRCADYGLTQPGGFYAGVWTPWKDGSARVEVQERSARFVARQSLRRMRDSATHGVPLSFDTPRSADERPVSLSAKH